ncbi:hypothetical protein ElP_28480 [Tautonia plasticadhaerens]|uniref:Uncharacterized protein n=1 Tax=Tautonia plasticadhaerens TaxID=2527974 RepID=A0A518H281_9BACT|nr:hypothetical protein ElP_28480 [Tautonia plasticadhaerens]
MNWAEQIAKGRETPHHLAYWLPGATFLSAWIAALVWALQDKEPPGRER